MHRIILTCILALSLRVTSACTCFPGHPQQQFCDAHFAVKVKTICATAYDVPDLQPYPNPYGDDGIYKIKYNAKVLQVFKGAWIKVNEDIELLTEGSSAACGLKIMNSTEDKSVWLITGYKYERKMYFNMCGFNRKWQDLTQEQIEGLEGNYGHPNCQCKVRSCFSNCPPPSRDTCTYSYTQWKCFNEKAYCKFATGHCVWENGKEC